MSNTTHSVSLENDAQKIKTSRKREEREARENSLPLADVIATSDVNSKNDQKEISKKDVIQHASPESTSQNTLNKYTAVKKSGSEKDNESVYGLQDISPKVKSNEISGLNNFLEKEPSSYRNEVKKSKVPTPNSNIKDIENKVKKPQLKPNSKSKSSTVLKANSESKLAQNNSTQSDPTKKKFEAATYTDFLRITDSPNSAEKHNSVEHKGDDAEMNDEPAKYTSSEKALKFQESKELDKENALSGSERNEERMEDSTEDDSMKSDDESKNVSENDDKLMGNKGKMSRDASEMESEDAISQRNSRKQLAVQANSDTSDDIPSNVEDPVMESDDDVKTSTKKFPKHSKETSQSETETMGSSSEEDHSDMSDSSSGEDEANETDKKDDDSESEDDSMESGKDLDVGSPQDEETVQENSEEETLGSPGDSKSTGENLKEHSLDSAEDFSRFQEDEQGPTEEPTESTSGLKEKSERAEKETKKIEHSDSEINIDFGNKVESIVDDNSENKAQQSDSLLSEKDMDRKTGDKTKDLDEKSDSKDDSLSKDGPEMNSDAGLTSSASEESSAVRIDGKNNVKGFGSSNSKTNLNNLNQADLELDDSSTGSRVDAEPDRSSHESRKAYEENSNVKTNSDHDSSSGEQKHEANVNSESNSKESNDNNTPPSEDDEKEINLEENSSEKTHDNSKQITNNEVDSKEATRKEDSANYLNSNEVNSDNDPEENKDTRENNLGVGSVLSDNENTTPSKDNTDNEVVIEATSKTGQSTVSPTMNNDDNTETKMENEKKIAQEENKEVKPEESGKIIETSYRVNDDDTSEDDGSRNQGKIGSPYHQSGGNPPSMEREFLHQRRWGLHI